MLSLFAALIGKAAYEYSIEGPPQDHLWGQTGSKLGVWARASRGPTGGILIEGGLQEGRTLARRRLEGVGGLLSILLGAKKKITPKSWPH